MRFVHDTLPQRVCFGSGEAAAHLEHEIAALGASRVMVIAAKEESNIADAITGNLRVVLRHDDVVMHVPVEVAARAREAAAPHNVDAIVSVGGGSTTGLAKAIALTTGLPIVAVPTTYAGSEATAVWGLTEGNRKTTGTDPRVLPKVIVYDATLTLTLPVPISVASGLNALAHCVDAMWAPKADPINAALAAEGIRARPRGCRRSSPTRPASTAASTPSTPRTSQRWRSRPPGSGCTTRSATCSAAPTTCRTPRRTPSCCPTCWPSTGPRHRHAEHRIAAAFGSNRAIDGLEDLRRELDAPRALRDYGFAEDAIPEAAEAILPAVPAGNPRPVTIADLERLLRAAWSGADPREAP